MIPYGRQEITSDDIDAVTAVLGADFITQGPAVSAFEGAVAGHVNAGFAIAVNSATSALHIACMALGLGPGDRLWTVPNTFVASANCGRYCGATVDFVDIDPVSWNMSVPALRAKLVQARREGTLPKVVVPVHFAGQPTEQEEIWSLAREFGFRVLEDASHAVGAARNGERVGSCRWSDVAVFSFHPVKIITSGEGGMALTNDSELAARMSRLRTHGITRDAALFVDDRARGNPPPWHYEQHELGLNYRMTDIHAALGLSQFGRLEHYVGRRNEIARRYMEQLSGLDLQLPSVLPGNLSAFHLFVVRLAGNPSPARHRRVFETLRAAGIGVNVHYIPVHLQPYYREAGFGEGQFPESERYAHSAFSLPMFPTMTELQQQTVVDAVADCLGETGQSASSR